LLSAIIGLGYGQHALTQAQYYTPPTPPTSATLGQAYSLGPQQLSQPIRQLYNAAPTAGQYSQLPAAAQYSAQQHQAQALPSNYGWQVQHQTLQQQQQQQQPQLQSQLQSQLQPQLQQQLQPQLQSQLQSQALAAGPAPLHRPASVHYAQIGENLAGDYRFGYRTGDGNSFREESRLPDGTVQGQYGFVDADGKQRLVRYQAGVGGYQVLGGGDGPAPASAVHSAPVARSAAPTAPAIPQWAQSHIGGTIPAAPQPQQQPQAVLGQYSSPSFAQQPAALQLGARFASPAAASSSPGFPAQHSATLQLGPGGAQFASPSAAAGHQNTLTIRPVAAFAVRAGSSTGAALPQSYGQPSAAAQQQAWGSHLG
ncbi:Cuticle protein-like protein, partial [Euroglyphus maynei]